MTPRVAPVVESDLDRVGGFLNAHLNRHISVEAWRRSFDICRRFSPPNKGMMLLDGESVVGVYNAYYSERTVGDRVERFCNLGAWCVLPSYRYAGMRLLRALLAQPGYTFTDLSPTGNVIPINERLGFQFLDSRTALMPTIPWRWRSDTITSDPGVLRSALQEPELQLYLDHAHAAAARHLLLRHGCEQCYLVFRMDRRTKPTGLLASVLHVSNEEVFRALLRPLLGYFLLRHGAAAMLAELRIIGSRPSGSLMLTTFLRKMYLSAALDPDEVDYFYSELVSVPF